MTVNVSKPAINVREKLAELDKPTGIAGEAMLRAETPQEQFNLIGAGRRNLIINGDMRIAQRGTSSTSNGYATVDRIKTSNASAQLAYTQEQASDGPEGFAKSYKFTVTTPETTLDSSDVVYIKYAVEDYDVQQLGFGTNEAKPITLSFWVKSSVVGDYAFTIWQMDGNKGYNVVYTINSANTWEYKTITISGNTADVINADSGIGFDLYFVLSSGSTYSSTSSMRDNWAPYTSAGFAYGQTADVMTNNGATWQITGVQLEVGKVATPFEHRSYGEELALCQRYFGKYRASGAYMAFPYSGLASDSSVTEMFGNHPAEMRTAPTITFNSTTAFRIVQAASDVDTTNMLVDFISTSACRLRPTGGSGLTTGQAVGLINKANTVAEIFFDAEL